MASGHCALGDTCGQVVSGMIASLKANGSAYKSLEGQLITAQPSCGAVMDCIAVLARPPDDVPGIQRDKATASTLNLLLDSLEASVKRAARLSGMAPPTKGTVHVDEHVQAHALTVVADAIQLHVGGKHSTLPSFCICRLARTCCIGASVERSDAEAFAKGVMDSGDHSCAVDLVHALQLQHAFPATSLVQSLAEKGDFAACEKACKTFECPEGVKERVVRSCLDSGRLKEGRRLAELWGLKGLYAEAQDKYCRASIDKFIGKGNLMMAMRFSERSRELQVKR